MVYCTLTLYLLIYGRTSCISATTERHCQTLRDSKARHIRPGADMISLVGLVLIYILKFKAVLVHCVSRAPGRL